MDIIKVNNIEVMKNPHGVSAKKLYDSVNVQAIHIALSSGESLKKHVTPVDVFFYVLEGNGKVEIGNEIKHVKKDELIISPANIPHCLHNDCDDIFRVLVVKTPKPTAKTIFLD